MNRTLNAQSSGRRSRIVYRAFLIIGILFFFGCSKESLDNVASNGSARSSAKKRLGVTWRYLRWMSDHGRNESITKLLKDHNQLVPPKANARTGADGAVTMGGNEGDDDGPGPGDCESGQEQCFDNDPGGGGATWRIDIPLTVNGQQLTISVVVVYDTDTGSPLLRVLRFMVITYPILLIM